MQRKSYLIFNERGLLIPPTLATLIGLNEAIMVQQIHYWLSKSPHEIDGELWIYNTYEQWQKQLPFWSVKTIQRLVLKLEKSGIVKSRQFDASQYNHRKWYTLDYAKLDSLQDN